MKQLTDLAEGRRVPQGAGAVMPYFAMNLTPEERRDIAAYVNSINTKPELSDLNELRSQGQTVGNIARGKILVMYGNGKVSACVTCHQYNGRGAPPMFPMIGQQKYTYLMNQLHNWHDRTRQNDPYQMMEIIAGKLSEQDMQDAAAYLSQAPRGGMGAADYATMSNIPQ